MEEYINLKKDIKENQRFYEVLHLSRMYRLIPEPRRRWRLVIGSAFIALAAGISTYACLDKPYPANNPVLHESFVSKNVSENVSERSPLTEYYKGGVR